MGGILLWINLKAIGKRKQATIALFIGIAFFVLQIVAVYLFPLKGSSFNFFMNLTGAIMLSELIYKKFLPDAESYPKKKIWIPLLIGLVISILFIVTVFF